MNTLWLYEVLAGLISESRSDESKYKYKIYHIMRSSHHSGHCYS